MRRLPLTAFLIALLVGPLAAQAPAAPAAPKPAAPVRLKPLRVSPACTITQDVGISQIKLSFSRPAVKGRKIWGGLVPYGEVWRTGANAATVVTFSHDAKVAGKAVPAGSYSFFAIPGEKQWTLILNRTADQWGAFSYKAADDLIRWEATPTQGRYQEWLDYRITPTAPGIALVELAWENLRVGFPVAFDQRAIYWAQLEETLKRAPETDWVPWYQAATYCQSEGIEPQKSLAWIETSLKAKETLWNHETAARIYKDAHRMPEALAHLQKAIDLARGKAPKEDIEKLEKELADWKGAK